MGRMCEARGRPAWTARPRRSPPIPTNVGRVAETPFEVTEPLVLVAADPAADARTLNVGRASPQTLPTAAMLG